MHDIWNPWHGCTKCSEGCENQKRADERIPILLELSFKHKGIMCAPFIGPVSIEKYLLEGQIEQVLCDGENYNGARPCHYVCNECHTAGMDSIIGLCLEETSRDPVAIIEKMMAMPFCHMHGPEHHVMVGAALLAAYKNAGGDINLSEALTARSLGKIGEIGAPDAVKGIPICRFFLP